MVSEQETRPVAGSGRIPLPIFPNYREMPARVPPAVWYGCRVVGVGLALGTALLCFVRPSAGLFVFWRLFAPVLPLVFFLAPSIWRNVCPMAALNQAPRRFRFTRGLTLPAWLREYGYVIAGGLFIALVAARKPVLDGNGPALGVVLLVALALAFVTGTIFKGKSGWCSSICPLLPLQRLYGQTPFLVLPNSYCNPCVTCVKHCYDFNPHTAHLDDLLDPDERHRDSRKLFAAALPGLILAFFTLPDPPAIAIPLLYLQFGLFMAASAGVFFAIQTLVKVPPPLLTASAGAVALNLFYWYALPLTVPAVAGSPLPPWLAWPLKGTLLALTAVWLFRTWNKARILTGAAPLLARRPGPVAATDRPAAVEDRPTVTFLPSEQRVPARRNASLLGVIEAAGLTIEAGCRMGMCGADPVAIRAGAEHLSLVTDDERTTLERLGLAANTRMACCARVHGPVTVSLRPERPQQPRRSMILGFRYDAAVQHVVIIGNGIAGVTAADQIRRRHPLCRIDLVGKERYHLYNRMGISRLVYGRSATEGLSLLPESWYREHQITCWLNTWALGIDPRARQVRLRTGETLPYDRLVLATGSSSFVPAIDGFGIPGTFLLREADDAMNIREFAQAHNCRRAVVAGGGPEGLEAAFALHALGLQVTVLERSDRLLHRHLDTRGSALLRTAIEALGIAISEGAEVTAVSGNDQVQKVGFAGGREYPCDLLLVCAGIRPNLALAQAARLETNLGVVVDDALRTSDPAIFAAGDVAEHNGQVTGLWPVAVKQAEVAAVNVAGGEARYDGTVPVMILKVPGIDLTSIGRIEAGPDGEVIMLEDAARGIYRKLVVEGGAIVGAIVLGSPQDAAAVTAAVKGKVDVDRFLAALRAGDWQVLEGQGH